MFHGKEMRGMEGEEESSEGTPESKAKLSSVRLCPSLDTIARQLGLVAAGPTTSVSGVLARMFIRTLTLVLLCLLPLVISRPHELTIHRNIHTGRCAIVRARRIPRHRRLSDEHRAVSSSRVLFSGDRDRTVEQLTLFATDSTSLQDFLSGICPHSSLAVVPYGSQPTDTAQQHPFAYGNEDFDPSDGVIPLEVTQLMASGPSSNRVDVTFFSDGCEPRDSPLPHVLTADRLVISLTRCPSLSCRSSL